MIILEANKNELNILQNEMLTSGSLNITKVQFRTSEEWEGLVKVACFRVEGNVPSPLATDVYLNEVVADEVEEISQECDIPYNMTLYAGSTLMVGLYGADPETKEVILPTVWVELGEIQQGTYMSHSSAVAPPTIVFPDQGEGGGLSAAEVNILIAKYLKNNPIEYQTLVGKPEPITNAQLKELLK